MFRKQEQSSTTRGPDAIRRDGTCKHCRWQPDACGGKILAPGIDMTRLTALGPLLLMCSMACSTSPGTARYKIAFVPSRSGQHGIFVMHSDNTGGKLLTEDPNARLRPVSWSPDGKMIAFLSFRPSDSEILRKPRVPAEYPLYVMNAGGTGQRKLIDCPVSGFGWSPNSRMLFFVSSYENPEANDPEVSSGKKNPASAIYIVDVQSGTTRRVTALGKNCFADWSPDGTRLALSSGTDTESNIFVVSIDGKHVRRLTDSSTLNLNPVWSPNGRTVAFMSLPSAGSENRETGVYTIEADGTNLRHVSDLICYDLSWTPDGRQLMLKSAVGIYLAATGGGKPTRLDLGSDRPLDAVFTPDGKDIMYRSNDEGEWQLYSVSIIGGKRRRVTSQMSASSFCLSPLLSKN